MSGPTISSIRCEFRGGHAHIDVWNRGGKAGTLVVERSDAVEIVEMLTRTPDTNIWWFEGKERLPPRDCWPVDFSKGEGKHAGYAPSPQVSFGTMEPGDEVEGDLDLGSKGGA